MKIYEFSKTICSIEWLQQLSLTYFSLINLFYYIDHLPIKLIKISPYNDHKPKISNDHKDADFPYKTLRMA